jgi:hypothetical protein
VGYQLERWSTSGGLLQTIERDAIWFPKGLDPTAELDRGGKQRAPDPTLQPMNVDQDGLILVYSWVPNSAWDTDSPDNDMVRAQNLHIEVIDPKTRVLIASEVVRVQALVSGIVPRFFFPGTRNGYIVVEGVAGPEIHLVEYKLVSNESALTR